MVAEIFEIIMIVLFGASWPFNLYKSIKSKTAKGKSFTFLMLIFVGYVFGVASKLAAPSFKGYVLFFYLLNLVMVGLDLIMYFINTRRDKIREAAQEKAA